jgi:ubiquinone/menaquinone biosynthesis C-methylase UbiE
LKDKDYIRWEDAQKAERRFWHRCSRDHLTQETWRNTINRYFEIDFDFFANKDVLDIGCGPAGLVYYIPECRSRIGIEPMYLSDILKYEPWKLKIVKRGNGEQLDFKDSSFDVVVCFNVLDHCIEPELVLKECYRTLRENGRVLLCVHTLREKYRVFQNLLNRVDSPHPHHFTLYQLDNIAKKYFKTERKRVVNGLGVNGHIAHGGNLKMLLGNYLMGNVSIIYSKYSRQ